MTLYETLGNDVKDAMKAGDTFKRDTIRLVQSAIKNSALDKRKDATELSDDEVMEVLKKLVKQRRDSVTQYMAGGRADLAKTEEDEIAVISEYLPAEMEDGVLEEIVRTALASAGMTEKKDMGKAMGVAMTAIRNSGGGASGDRVKAAVESILQ